MMDDDLDLSAVLSDWFIIITVTEFKIPPGASMVVV